jgi:hypothetical protein
VNRMSACSLADRALPGPPMGSMAFTLLGSGCCRSLERREQQRQGAGAEVVQDCVCVCVCAGRGGEVKRLCSLHSTHALLLSSHQKDSPPQLRQHLWQFKQIDVRGPTYAFPTERAGGTPDVNLLALPQELLAELWLTLHTAHTAATGFVRTLLGPGCCTKT